MTLPNVVIAFLVVTVLALFGQKAGFWAQPRSAVVAVAPAPAVVVASPAVVSPLAAVGPPAAVAPPTAMATPAAVVPSAGVAPPAAVAPPPAALAAATVMPDGHETIDILPAGAGREETFLACTICHNTALIRRSGFSRDRWDDLMDWMVEKQGMNPLDPPMRTAIVDYLAAAFPPRQSPRGRNPFATP